MSLSYILKREVWSNAMLPLFYLFERACTCNVHFCFVNVHFCFVNVHFYFINVHFCLSGKYLLHFHQRHLRLPIRNLPLHHILYQFFQIYVSDIQELIFIQMSLAFIQTFCKIERNHLIAVRCCRYVVSQFYPLFGAQPCLFFQLSLGCCQSVF